MSLQLLDDDVVPPQRVDPLGRSGPTPNQSRGPHWRRVAAGLFVPSTTDADTTRQRIVEAVAGALADGAATGWAALHWWGADWFEGRTATGEPLPVPVALGDRPRRDCRPGVQYWHDWLFETDVVSHRGLPVTRPERAVCQQALRARTFEEALRVVDMAAASDLVSLAELRSYVARLPGRPGIRRLRSVVDVADENVWSPMETTLRLTWIAAVPGADLLCNSPVFGSDGQHLLTPDVIDPVTGVVGEYDGVVHDASRVRRRDLEREERAREHGLAVVSMTSCDLSDLQLFSRRLAAAYQRQRSQPGPRGWTLEHPEWWTDRSTVALRRALAAT